MVGDAADLGDTFVFFGIGQNNFVRNGDRFVRHTITKVNSVLIQRDPSNTVSECECLKCLDELLVS